MSSAFWISQSPLSDPGNDPKLLEAINALPSDIASLRDIVSQFCLHYQARRSEVRPDRLDEIHTRYAGVMFERILSRNPSLTAKRSSDERTVGCCRDSALLLASILRQKGIPARIRIGSAAYFSPGKMIDHTVTEMWDADLKRWRLVDPDMPVGWKKYAYGKQVDFLDLRPGIDFQNGSEAWLSARSGEIDASNYIIGESVAFKGLPYLAVNVQSDLAAMNKQEMLLWDLWGIGAECTPDSMPDEMIPVADEISMSLIDREIEPEKIQQFMQRSNLALTEEILRLDPNSPAAGPKKVNVARALGKV
ncbi:hypothetical protein VHEMI06167 [[Torrubiella] hemipterigena]|uniref:Transglutaminase-like domain-containing protein n=1 Tax=[Torrubiella] hemipterigena TaxID=1531966 RepID=A0A0A1T6C8_9HYPO|nr:hypothetical protein VHEMI06167 [[Torrubiella] hemipterigena]